MSTGQDEWKDGFLFLGNRIALDFLNTRPTLETGPTEFLTDTNALERWIVASGTLLSAKAKLSMRTWRDSSAAKRMLQELIGFRERLRDAVLRMESGRLPTDAFIAEVNERLVRHPLHTLLSKCDGSLVREQRNALDHPSDLWPILMEDIANLLATPDTSRLRKCESCVLHFLDTSKKGSRRWCSMGICGNKLKVAAYQSRKRIFESAASV